MLNTPIQSFYMPSFRNSLRWDTNRTHLDYITPAELQRTIYLQDMDRYLGEGKDVITTNITDSYWRSRN